MKQALVATLAALALGGCAAIPQEGSTGEMKVAFDVTSGNPKVVMKTLEIIDVTRKQLIESGVSPKIVIAFRGDASYYTNTNLALVKEADRADALQIRASIRNLHKATGVEGLEQCNLPLADRKLKPTDVIQEVKVVPNGWISLAKYQQQGYSYIAP